MNYSALYNHFSRGDSLFIAGTSAEPRAFVNALSGASDLPGITVTHTFIPGVNTEPLAMQDNSINEITFFPRPSELFNTNRIRFKRNSWLEVYAYLEQQRFDWLVLQLSLPNENGQCSLGTSVEFLPLLLQRSHKLIGIINRQVPFIANGPAIAIDSLSLSIECDEPVVSVASPASDSTSVMIADHLMTLIEQDTVLQVGIGNIPDIFLKSLKQHTNLKFESGMLSDGFLELYDAGALDQNFRHHCTLCLGSQGFYKRLPEISNLSLVPVDISHAKPVKNTAERFLAINSAMQVDCGGRANLEFLGEKRISNVGGAMDFAQRANQGKYSLNVIAMPATAANGKYSRIVSNLTSPRHDSLAGTHIDYVVTEYGMADLRGKSTKQCAQAMIEIAAPKFRPDLEKTF